MKAIRIVLLVLLYSILTVSCKEKITEGTVVEKTYRPSWVYMQPHMIGESVMLMPMTMPETWYVVIEKDGETACYNVRKEYFDEIVIGQELKIEKKKRNDSKNRKRTL